MKILLLGEFSSLHRYLKEGLLELGQDVKLYANGDGWKQIGGADGNLFVNNVSKYQKPYYFYCEPFVKSKAFCDYDVVQLVSPQIYPILVNTELVRSIARRNKCLSMVAAGEDYAIAKAYLEKKFDYYIFDTNKESLGNYTSNTLRSKLSIKTEKQVTDLADIIIPSLYEYTVGYQNTGKLNSVIPFPVNLSNLTYQENKPMGKIVFFHGLNREESKGTRFIRTALERLQENYPNDVEIIIDGHMPFARYVEVMQKANVIVDQCCSYGYGINACLAMAQGKVVMSGARTETLHAFGIDESPIIPAKPDVDSLYQNLVYIVENKNNISEWGYRSRQYVENLHDHIKVAQQYMDAWQSTGKV